MSRIWKWFSSKRMKREGTYEEEKREFEMAIGTPFISVRVEMPEGFEELRRQFLELESNPQFLEEVRDLVKKRLSFVKRGLESPA